MDRSKDSCGKERARKFGPMEQNTKDIGETLAHGEWESSPTKMETAMKDNGCIIKPMAPEHTEEKMAAATKEDGEETFSTAKENKPGKTEVTTKEALYKVSSKDTASISGRMAIFMKEIGRIISSTARESKNCTMDGSIKDNG